MEKIESDSLKDAYSYLGEIEANICSYKQQLRTLQLAKKNILIDIQALINNIKTDAPE